MKICGSYGSRCSQRRVHSQLVIRRATNSKLGWSVNIFTLRCCCNHCRWTSSWWGIFRDQWQPNTWYIHSSYKSIRYGNGGMYPCSTKTREVLGNPSPMPERFPETTVPQSQGDPKIVKRGPNFWQKGDPFWRKRGPKIWIFQNCSQRANMLK